MFIGIIFDIKFVREHSKYRIVYSNIRLELLSIYFKLELTKTNLPQRTSMFITDLKFRAINALALLLSIYFTEIMIIML